MKEMLRFGFILGIICLLSSGVLALVNSATEPAIARQKIEQENAALREVLPSAQEFAPVKDGEDVLYYVGLGQDKKAMGFAFKAKARGYSSDIEVLAGVDREMRITAIKVLSQNETPGLGTRVAEAPFMAQFAGKGVDAVGGVSTIAGATVSSSALVRAVKDAFTEKAGLMRKELDNGK